MYSAKNDNSELGYLLRSLSFQSFGRILDYHEIALRIVLPKIPRFPSFPRIPSYRHGHKTSDN